MAPIRRKQSVEPHPPPQTKPETGLRDHPDTDHVPEDYSDVVTPETDVFEPEAYQEMERRLPPLLLGATRTRHEKLWFMRSIISNHLPEPESRIMVRT
jgi:hypothetical protein